MKYRIVHRTTHTYKSPVAVGNHVACLSPRTFPAHQCLSHELIIQPSPATLSSRIDYFGNQQTIFTVQKAHTVLTVEARSEVVVSEPSPWPEQTPPWEQVAQRLKSDLAPDALEAYQFVFESPRIRPSADFAAYARRSFGSGTPLARGLLDLTHRIHTEFRFDAKATNVGTTSEEVLRKRRGVCQDFAHLQIACLRSIGLPARYVSGYLRTYPPPGRPRLVGADASHAWLSVFCPGAGWLDVDPTNDMVPSRSHVTLAWGRDYGDVGPLRGLILGGREHSLKVGVDMEPLDKD